MEFENPTGGKHVNLLTACGRNLLRRWTMDTTFLAPIENPAGAVMRMAYAMAKRQFGKVPTPVKVVYARMPAAFGMFVGKIAKLDRKLELPPETAMLIR